MPVLGVQPNFAKLYRIMNTSLVGVKSEYLYLGGINILVESRYLAQINTLPFYFHLKPPILICVVRVIQRRYILIQNTFITEARYGKFFFHYSFVAFNSHNVGIADIFWGEALCQNMLENAFFVFWQLWLFKLNRPSLPFLTESRLQMFDLASLKFCQT